MFFPGAHITPLHKTLQHGCFPCVLGMKSTQPVCPAPSFIPISLPAPHPSTLQPLRCLPVPWNLAGLAGRRSRPHTEVSSTRIPLLQIFPCFLLFIIQILMPPPKRHFLTTYPHHSQAWLGGKLKKKNTTTKKTDGCSDPSSYPLNRLAGAKRHHLNVFLNFVLYTAVT